MTKKKAKIQIAEDETIIAMEIEERLKSLGYEVTSISASGEDAVEKAGQLKPDLVLMDIVLQGDMDGIDAAGQIRDRFDIPVVFLTAYADDKTLARAKLSGPFGYLLKPFGERDLYTAIEIGLYKNGIERELKQAVAFKSEILANVSHELRTPLTVIMGYIDFMVKDRAEPLADKHRERLTHALRNSKSLLKLIENLLAASTIDSGERLLACDTFRLDELVRECVEDRRDTAGNKAIAVEVRLDRAEITMSTDARKVQAIVGSLLSNALKFTEQGTVAVSAFPCPDRPDWACIEVHDEGIGIAPEHHAMIFEKFKQIDGSFTRKYPGNGLGLYIVKTYADMLGGEVGVESDVGKGSTFRVRLPMTPKDKG